MGHVWDHLGILLGAPVLGWLQDHIVMILALFWDPFWRPSWSLFWYHFVSNFRSPKHIAKRTGALPCPGAVVHTPPSSDSSPLVKPLRVLPERHRTHWASQSFPEQQTSVLSQQQTSVLSQQQTSVLSQQKTSVLSQPVLARTGKLINVR